MWHWKQCSPNDFVLRGPLGSSKWFKSYDELHRFCLSKGIDAKQV